MSDKPKCSVCDGKSGHDGWGCSACKVTSEQVLINNLSHAIDKGDKEAFKKTVSELEATIPAVCNHSIPAGSPCFRCEKKLNVCVSKHGNYLAVLKLRTLVVNRQNDLINSVLSRKGGATFKDLFNKELILSLCKDTEEQLVIINNYRAMDYYQQLADRM